MVIFVLFFCKLYSRDFDGNYRFICDEDSEGVDVTIINVWFNAVSEQPVSKTQL